LPSALVAAPSCSADRPSLALRSHAGAGGQAGLGGQGGAGGHGGVLSRPQVAGAGGLMPSMHIEPPGRSVFTLVHGIVDADATVFCFGRVSNGVTTLVGSPVPQGGLAYGGTLSFETIDGIDSTQDGVAPFVISGDLSQIDGLDCVDAVARAQAVMQADRGPTGAGGTSAQEQGGAAGETLAAGAAGAHEGGASGAPEVAGTSASGTAPATGGEGGEAGAPAAKPPALRVGALPGLPVGSLAAGYSMLEVADGCLGARAFTGPNSRDACGADYTPEHGSLSAEVVILARETADGFLALQALHASRASGDLGISTVPGASDDGQTLSLVDDMPEGALRPSDPRDDLPSTLWGVNNVSWSIAATVNGVTYATEIWPGVRRIAGITKFVDGRGYTLIAIGPDVELQSPGFWHNFAFTAVDNDPSVQ
jgi:hypothetical protein